MALSGRPGDVVRQTDNPRRAALDLLGMLVVAAALLAAPCVYANVRIDSARRPAPEVAAAIRHSDCSQLRAQFNEVRADNRSGAAFDLLGRDAETARLIVERGEQLHCRPRIRLPAPSD